MPSWPAHISNALLSYPISGRTWLRYCIETLCERPTLDVSVLPTKFSQPLSGPAILRATHDLRDIIVGKSSIQKLILLIRDYKENIYCYNIHNGPDVQDIEAFVKNNYGGKQKKTHWCVPVDYMGSVSLFHQWEKPKLIVYYEDFILDPTVICKKIFNFLEVDIPEDRYDNFLKRYDFHKSRGIKAHHRPITQGDPNKLRGFHTGHLSFDFKKEWDDGIRTLDPEAYDLYLARYKESDGTHTT